MKTRGIVTARMGSTRLPGKSLLPILGMPLIGRLLERLSRAKSLDEIIVATPNTPENQPLVEYVRSIGHGVFQGSEHDVLDRVYRAARDLDHNRVVLVTGDCPLIDPELVDDTVQYFTDGGYDFVTNADPPTFPDGLDTAVFTFKLLEQAWLHADRASEREHVTLWMKKEPHPSLMFDQPPYPYSGTLTGFPDNSSMRWCVDEPRDLIFVRAIYERLYRKNPRFSRFDVYDLLQQEPDLLQLNAGIARNEGLRKSLEAEA